VLSDPNVNKYYIIISKYVRYGKDADWGGQIRTIYIKNV
jgi:hypothetical protein